MAPEPRGGAVRNGPPGERGGGRMLPASVRGLRRVEPEREDAGGRGRARRTEPGDRARRSAGQGDTHGRHDVAGNRHRMSYDFDRAPTRAQAMLAVFLSLVCATGFAALAFAVFISGGPTAQIASGVFAAMCLFCLWICGRAASGRRRRPSQRALSVLAWTLVAMGAGAVLASWWLSLPLGRGSLAGSGLACVALGIATRRRARR